MITFQDKVTLNENADIPAVNKISASDVNALKSGINSNETKILNITGQILWTNQDPTQNISQTTDISLSSSDYDILEIYYIQATNSTSLMYSNKILKGASTRIRISTPDGANIYRGMTYLSDTSYRIDLPYSETTLSNIYSLVIPYKIIGYKTGLFN